MIVTEFELRANWHKTKAKRINLPPGSVLTPSARDFLRSKNVEVQIEGNGLQDLNKKNLSNVRQTMLQESSNFGSGKSMGGLSVSGGQKKKPEYMTHLHGNQLVLKTHPVIAYRGQLDLFDCALVKTQADLAAAGEQKLAAQLDEVAKFAQKLMVAEVRDELMEFSSLLGWTPEQIQEMSHYPDKYFGVSHTHMNYKDGAVIASLHCLRSKIREVELYANRAFTGENGECQRRDIILALNRLSSLFYVLICKLRGEKKQEKTVPIGVSNRHVHLSQADLEALFGSGYVLQVKKELSQPGQFAANETITLEGSKGKIEKVRILGPVRSESQVEISATDSFQLGVKPIVRDSGQLEGTSGIRLIGPKGSVDIKRGVIVAARHIHIDPEQAKTWKLHDGQRVKVKISSTRPVIFQDVLVRLSSKYRLEMHVDTDEANAALVINGTQGIIMGV